METVSKGSFDPGFTIGIGILGAVAVALVISGAPAAALSAWIVLAEIIYLSWAAWGEHPHRGDAAAFAFLMNIQSGVRVMMWTVLAMTVLMAASLLPAVAPAAVIGWFVASGDPGDAALAMLKLAMAGSIALAAVRLKRVHQRGVSARSLADGSYRKHSVRLQSAVNDVEEALDEQLAYLALADAPKLSGLLRASQVRVLRNDEDGRPITRLYFSNFPLRATISLRQVDQHHTDLRIWFRVRGAYLLSELFPNPVNVAKLQEFLEEALIEPVQANLNKTVAETSPLATPAEPQALFTAAAA
jgi:hypothetical protein